MKNINLQQSLIQQPTPCRLSVKEFIAHAVLSLQDCFAGEVKAQNEDIEISFDNGERFVLHVTQEVAT